MDPVTGFATLFCGSTAAYGTEEGGCDKDTSLSYYERIVQHLEGDRPTGVYPLAMVHGEWRVHWGCVDFDEGDDKSWAYARNVAQVISAMGGCGWVERSRSKGYHVWLFLDDWYPAVLVREALLGACQTVDAPTKEVNPKSVSLAEGQVGNYVRLPYPGAYDTADQPRFPVDRRTMVDPDGTSIPMEDFVRHALKHLAGRPVLEAMRALYKPPAPIARAPLGPVGDGDIYKRMSGLAHTIYKDGPLEGAGRGHTLFKFACVLAEDGQHTAGEAFALCVEADQRWGKFHERANGEATIEGIVRKAFGAL